MMNEALIDKYIRNEMDKQEKLLFDTMLSSDNELKAAVELRHDIAQAIQESDVIFLRNQLDNIHKDLYGVTRSRKFSLMWTKAAATVAIIMVASVLYLWLGNSSMSKQELISEYYAPYESILRVRSSNQAESVISKAMTAYDLHQYNEAEILFEQALEAYPEKVVLKLYAGIASIETENYDHASALFTSILQNQKNPYTEHAEWYLAISYLKQDKIENAMKQLEIIENNKNNYYNKKAKQLTRKLRRIK